jgi:CheY-like chemotaxis protein
LARLSPDLIISDILMPNWLQRAGAAAQDPRTDAIPFVIIRHERARRPAARHEPPARTITTKPFTRDQLLAAIGPPGAAGGCAARPEQLDELRHGIAASSRTS